MSNNPATNYEKSNNPGKDNRILGHFFGRIVVDRTIGWGFEEAVLDEFADGVRIVEDEDNWTLPYLSMATLADPKLIDGKPITREQIAAPLELPINRVLARSLARNLDVSFDSVSYRQLGGRTKKGTRAKHDDLVRGLLAARIHKEDALDLIEELSAFRTAVGAPIAQRQLQYSPGARITEVPLLQISGQRRVAHSPQMETMLQTVAEPLTRSACEFGPAELHEF
jgi:hypothetical protein